MREEKQNIDYRKIPVERSQFLSLLAKNPNYFGTLEQSEWQPEAKIVENTSYEELTCIGYNPRTRLMEATFTIKRPFGYSGGLCTPGSREYVRFYLDFHDGTGFIDQGLAAVNVHDIPEHTDCAGQSTFPLVYSVTKEKETNRYSICKEPLLPTLRVILSWNVEPPANSPFWTPPWGNTRECDVQFAPFFFIPAIELKPEIYDFLELAMDHPDLPVKELAQISKANISELKPLPSKVSIEKLLEKYRQFDVPASRFALKSVSEIVSAPLAEQSQYKLQVLSKLEIDYGKIIDGLTLKLPDKTKANVDYEEIECLGFDYHKEHLVASIAIKRSAGYSGDLCDEGSTEYVAFWVDWDDDCEWTYLDTVQLDVHDIEMKGDKLCYMVTLPLDTKYHRRLCSKPNIVRARAVLSWNVPPSTTDPNELKTYGNRVDAHIQIQPGPKLEPGKIIPVFNIIGGIPVDHISDLTGLTKGTAFFAKNGLPVPGAAPFGGVIVVNGPSFPGHRYRLRATNLDNGSVRLIDNNFTVVGYLPVPPWVQYTTQSADPVGKWYDYLHTSKNTLNILGRFNLGTEDRWLVELEIEGVAGVFSKVLQMDHIDPDVSIQVNDGGDCTAFKKGDTITGVINVFDKHLRSWNFGSTWGGAMSGTANTGPGGIAFAIPTTANAHPCGSISLRAWDRTILNSQSVGRYEPTSYNICLQEP